MSRKTQPAFVPDALQRRPPVRVRTRRITASFAKLYPPDGEGKIWWGRLKKALGTGSSDFVNASLHQLQAAAQLPGSGISETGINAALAMIEGFAPQNEVEAALAVQMACNAQAHYMLFCNPKAEGCLTPEQGRDYLVIDQNTHWKPPGAKGFPTLAFLQDLLGKYDNVTSEHIGLVSDGGGLGIYLLDRTAGGYQPDTILNDGPIFYGTGMNEADRQRVWKSFFLKMVEAVARQQGKDALEAKITPRCFQGEDYCTTALDANFVGVGGGKEPRKVLVFVTHDIRDPRMEFQRVVCTWRIGERVCRDWSTGKFRADLE